MKNSNLVKGLDENIITEEETIELANETWQDLINKGESSDKERLFQFSDYLVFLSDRSKGFACKLAHDSDGGTNGVVWQTATMRSNFERIGPHTCMDVMKRSINKIL